MHEKLTFRELTASDSQSLQEFIDQHWGGEPLVIRGKKYYPSSLPGILVQDNKKIVGFLIYEIRNNICEIIVFEIFDKFKGIGTHLLDKLKQIAKNHQCSKLYLMTTNDNLDALRFYQKRGFQICAIHLNSVRISRQIKPAIAEIGDYGIPIRDEIDLEMPI